MAFQPQFRQIRRGVTLLALCGGFARSASAQNAPAQNAPAQNTPQIVQFGVSIPAIASPIRVRNVQPSLMAWWLAPESHAEPPQLQKSRRNRELNPLLSEKADLKPKLPALPAGIERIVAIDPQNALLAFGTEAGIEELKTIVAGLDKPLRRVEIQGQFVQITAQNARALGVRFPAPVEGKSAISRVGKDFEAVLARLVATQKAKVITAPRVTAINGLTADLSYERSEPVQVDITTRPQMGEKPITLSGAAGQILVTGTRLSFAARPSVTPDDSIDLQLAPAQILSLSLASSIPNAGKQPTFAKKEVILRRVLQGVLIETAVKDGQTIAISGYDSRFIQSPLQPAAKPAANVLLFVTARIIRRAEDDEQTAKVQTAKLVAPKP